MISTALGTQLPGPGAIYINQSLHFGGPVGLGDAITVTVKVAEKKPEKYRVVLDCQAVNQLDHFVGGTAFARNQHCPPVGAPMSPAWGARGPLCRDLTLRKSVESRNLKQGRHPVNVG